LPWLKTEALTAEMRKQRQCDLTTKTKDTKSGKSGYFGVERVKIRAKGSNFGKVPDKQVSKKGCLTFVDVVELRILSCAVTNSNLKVCLVREKI
jgi:hypothetical protein